MEIKVTRDYENKLVGRREINAFASYPDKTPNKEEVKQELCKSLGLNPELVEIRKIKQQYGLKISDIIAYSYANKEIMGSLVKKRGKKGKKTPEKSTATA